MYASFISIALVAAIIVGLVVRHLLDTEKTVIAIVVSLLFLFFALMLTSFLPKIVASARKRDASEDKP